jgi:hypothetical protein
MSEEEREQTREKGRQYNEINKEALREKARERARKYQSEDPERVREWGRKYREAHKAQRAEHYRDRWRQIREETATRPRPSHCEICGVPAAIRALDFDHDHASGRFRGWICRRCNTTLGFCDDDPTQLRALADYLEQDTEGSPGQ